jgi:alpha-beta hydrolase superfamily lysophospholipase
MRPPCSPRCSLLARLGCAVLAVLTLSAAAPAQDQAKTNRQLPAAQDVTLTTKDGLKLGATFYPGTKGRESVPVLLLHMRKGSRVDYQELALALQAAGHAVLVPDLRGHGNSTWTISKSKVEPEKMTRRQIESMELDVEACKSFLMDKNNAGELNIDKLCVVGAELGAMLAMNWSAKDWDAPPLAVGKQGQDVKALVLLSPAWSVNGYNVNSALRSGAVQKGLLMYIIAGKGETDAKRIEQSIKRYRGDEKEKNQSKTYFTARLPTTLQGTKLLTSQELELATRITNFIEQQVVPLKFPWKDRKLF